MKKLCFIFGLLLLNNPIAAFSADPEYPAPEETTAPAVYAQDNAAPDNSAPQDTSVQSGASLNFGNFKSNTLVQRAWAALASNDLDAVKGYVHKTNELYSNKAKEMQANLQDYVPGDNKDEVFKYWALNDLSTAWYILGEAYHNAGQNDDALKAYGKVVNDFSFGQCWDIKGFFWKPAQAAKAKIAMIQSGLKLDLGDYTSSTLVQKAWASLAANDVKSVEFYVNETNELYGSQAKEMQANLQDYVSGDKNEVFKYWALNDVSTAWYILGEAYRTAGKNDEAVKAYNKTISDFSFGQCWDSKGWFWRPAQAAKEKIAMIQSGVNVDFGDYSSSTLVQKAWASLSAGDLKSVEFYVNKADELYSNKAKEMQASLQDYASGSNDDIFKDWALNDLGTAWFILGEAYHAAGKDAEAAKAYKKIINEYTFAQCWDPQGWFWKPSEAAQQKLVELGVN